LASFPPVVEPQLVDPVGKKRLIVNVRLSSTNRNAGTRRSAREKALFYFPRHGHWEPLHPKIQIAVHAASRLWVDKHATKEKLVTPRAPKALTIKTCPGEANQPGSGKVHAHVFGQIVFKDIYDNDNE